MALTGKGFFIWKIQEAEDGDPQAIARAASQAGLTHVLIKIADGKNTYGAHPETGFDQVPALVQALKARAIQAWGWQYVYGYDPIGEADRAVQRVRHLGLHGYVVDAEAEYKQAGMAKAARQFMARLRAGLPNLPVALSSYRFPSLHPQFPFTAFLERCDYNMPQVYWLHSRNPGAQLQRCVNEFKSLGRYRPIIPVGAAFSDKDWSPTPAEQIEFLRAAQSLELTGANFYEWSQARRDLPDSWNAVHGYAWSPAATGETARQLIEAMNTHDPGKVLALYGPDPLHVTAARTIRGPEALRAWYRTLFDEILPGATFRLAGYSAEGTSLRFDWTAVSSAGSVTDGSDTLAMVNGKIAYHYAAFSVR